MIESVEDGDERIGRLLNELATYGVIDAGAGLDTDTGAGAGAATGTDAGNAETNPASNRTVDGSMGIKSVFADLPTTGKSGFDEAIVKENLEAVLLVLISIRNGAHGKRLMGDLSDFFDAQLSPGTVYPRLHDLEAAGILQVHELVRTKEYTIADETGARERIERAMRQHLTLGAVFRASLDHLERTRSESG